MGIGEIVFIETDIYICSYCKKQKHKDAMHRIWYDAHNTGECCICNSKRQNKNGKIYFILSPKMKCVKIGFSTHVSQRLLALQSANPDKLELLCEIDGTQMYEAYIQELFKDDSVRYEWFRYSKKLKNYIEEIKNNADLSDFLQVRGS